LATEGILFCVDVSNSDKTGEDGAGKYLLTDITGRFLMLLPETSPKVRRAI
jgi:hypothetical protein